MNRKGILLIVAALFIVILAATAYVNWLLSVDPLATIASLDCKKFDWVQPEKGAAVVDNDFTRALVDTSVKIDRIKSYGTDRTLISKKCFGIFIYRPSDKYGSNIRWVSYYDGAGNIKMLIFKNAFIFEIRTYKVDISNFK